MQYEGTIILRHGSKISLKDWQQIYGLKVGSAEVGKYFKIGEKNKKRNVAIKNGFTISELMIRLLDEVRILRGKPLFLNCLDRTQDEQDYLTSIGKRTATTSPHVFFMAGDADEDNAAETIVLAKQFETAARRLGIKVRLGYKKYLKDGDSFVHADVCVEYYAPGKPFHDQPHPWQWEVEARW